ncbi:MAG: EexN family lipoprotein [Gammaproteobacteria bacterium]
MRYALALPIAMLALTGCEEPQPRGVAEFLENEAALYGALERCENLPGAGADAECRNARQAAERIAAIEERAMRKGREQAFETARAEYRERLDRERSLRMKAEAEAEEARLQSLIGEIFEPSEPGESTAPAESAAPAEAIEPAAPGEPGEPAGQVEPAQPGEAPAIDPAVDAQD